MFRVEGVNRWEDMLDAELARRVVFVAHHMRHRRIVDDALIQSAYCLQSYPCQGHSGLVLSMEDGTEQELDCGDNSMLIGAIRFWIRGENTAHCSRYVSASTKLEIGRAFDCISATYWVASQQSWKDLAEDFIPYYIAAIGVLKTDPELRNDGDEQTTTKRQRV